MVAGPDLPACHWFITPVLSSADMETDTQGSVVLLTGVQNWVQ